MTSEAPTDLAVGLRVFLEQFDQVMRTGGCLVRPEWRYQTIAGLLLAEGRPACPEALTPEELKIYRAARRRANSPFPVRHCYANAQLLVCMDKSKRLEYCEGYATRADVGLPVNHAWVQIHGKVIDVTWREGPLGSGKPIVGEHADFAYLGVVLPRESLWKRGRDSLPVLDDWQNGFPYLRNGMAAGQLSTGIRP